MYLTRFFRALRHRSPYFHKPTRLLFIGLILCVPGLLALGALVEVTFVGKNVSFQIPAEINFDLDLSKIESDNIYIRKSKDDLEGFKVSKSQKEWKTVYQYPGYYKAQLLVDNELVKVHDVFVKSYGWVGTLSNGKKIEYLNTKDLKCEAMIGLSESKLEEVHNSFDIPMLTFHYFDQINPVSGLDFTLETQLRNTYDSYAAPCRNIKIEIVGTSSSFIIPLSLNACSFTEAVVIAGQEFYPTQVDLSKLQADFKNWQKLKIDVHGGLVQFYLNDEFRLALPVRASIGQIVGFRYHFEGAGEVNMVKLTDTRDIIYAAPF